MLHCKRTNTLIHTFRSCASVSVFASARARVCTYMCIIVCVFVYIVGPANRNCFFSHREITAQDNDELMM